MPTRFDRITESARERALMETIRRGRVSPEAVEAHGLPFFLKLQIQTTSRCNARCVMCPWTETATRLPQGAMDEPVFRRILEQLPGRGVERTGLFLMNEPLLDSRLEVWVALLKETVPGTAALIFTNGLLLTADRAESLARAGLDEVNVSVVGFTRAVYARSMGVDGYDRVLANLSAVGARRRRGALGRMRLKVIALDLPGVREGLEAFEERTGLTEIYFKPATNRAGNVALAPIRGDAPAAATARPRACQRPFVKAYILYNGDMVLCNCDWQRTTLIGNVMEESLETLWRGPRLREVRRHHVRGVYPEGSLCAGCDYPYRS